MQKHAEILAKYGSIFINSVNRVLEPFRVRGEKRKLTSGYPTNVFPLEEISPKGFARLKRMRR